MNSVFLKISRWLKARWLKAKLEAKRVVLPAASGGQAIKVGDIAKNP